MLSMQNEACHIISNRDLVLVKEEEYLFDRQILIIIKMI